MHTVGFKQLNVSLSETQVQRSQILKFVSTLILVCVGLRINSPLILH